MQVLIVGQKHVHVTKSIDLPGSYLLCPGNFGKPCLSAAQGRAHGSVPVSYPIIGGEPAFNMSILGCSEYRQPEVLFRGQCAETLPIDCFELSIHTAMGQ